MGLLLKIVDATLFGFFAVIGFAAPLLDAQTCLPQRLFPQPLIQLKSLYVREFDDYLVKEKPHFFVGLVWVELILQWPLAIANLYAIFASKTWLPTTCLIYGVSVFTSMVTILSEMIGSGRASDKLLQAYFPFLGLAVLAMARGLIPRSNTNASTVGNGTALRRKKKA